MSALVLLLSACSSGSDSSSVAAGPGTPVPTTRPINLPPVVTQPDQAAPLATAEPDQTENAASPALPTLEPEATVEPPVEPTAEPTAQPTVEPTSEPTVAPVATTDPAAASTVPATEATSAPVPAPQGSTISLGDFDVVNLVTGATQNIAELSPSGPTMLWFWAPH